MIKEIFYSIKHGLHPPGSSFEVIVRSCRKFIARQIKRKKRKVTLEIQVSHLLKIDTLRMHCVFADYLNKKSKTKHL